MANDDHEYSLTAISDVIALVQDAALKEAASIFAAQKKAASTLQHDAPIVGTSALLQSFADDEPERARLLLERAEARLDAAAAASAAARDKEKTDEKLPPNSFPPPVISS